MKSDTTRHSTRICILFITLFCSGEGDIYKTRPPAGDSDAYWGRNPRQWSIISISIYMYQYVIVLFRRRPYSYNTPCWRFRHVLRRKYATTRNGTRRICHWTSGKRRASRNGGRKKRLVTMVTERKTSLDCLNCSDFTVKHLFCEAIYQDIFTRLYLHPLSYLVL